MAKGSGRNTETKAALRRDGGFIYLCLLFRPVGFCFSKILRLCRNPPSQNPPVLLPRKSGCCHTLPHRRVRRQPLFRASWKQGYNTLDFASKIVCQQGCSRPYWKPRGNGMFPLQSLIFLAGAYTNSKMQLDSTARK